MPAGPRGRRKTGSRRGAVIARWAPRAAAYLEGLAWFVGFGDGKVLDTTRIDSAIGGDWPARPGGLFLRNAGYSAYRALVARAGLEPTLAHCWARDTEVMAILYSLAESTKLAGVEPRYYLIRATRAALEDPGTVTLPHSADHTACTSSGRVGYGEHLRDRFQAVSLPNESLLAIRGESRAYGGHVVHGTESPVQRTT